LSPAEIVDLGDGYSVKWPEPHITISIEYLHKQAHGLIGEMTVRNGTAILCESLRINLNTEPRTKGIAKKVHEYDGRLSLDGWARLIESTCVLILRRHREGEPLRILTVETPVEPLTYQISPFVFLGKPSVMFGDGGLGKSSFALFLAMLVSVGEYQAGIAAISGTPLFLDWEDSYDVHVRRMQAISACHPKLALATVRYQSLTEPLANLTQPLLRRIQTDGISFLVIDSLAAATGGDAGAEAATKVFRPIRTLRVGALVVAHIPKTQGEGQDPSIYGSVFNKNFSRSTWELRREQDVDEDSAVIGLFNRKSNLSRLHPPIGLKVTQNQDNTRIQYEPFDLSQAAELKASLPWPNQIRNLLEDGDPRTSSEIAEALGAKLAVIKTTLSRHRDRKWQSLGEGRDTKWTVWGA
jgi:hypothetical protein